MSDHKMCVRAPRVPTVVQGKALRAMGPFGHGPAVKRRRRQLPSKLIERVDAAIVSSLQTELIHKLTGCGLHRQTPQALADMLMALDDMGVDKPKGVA